MSVCMWKPHCGFTLLQCYNDIFFRDVPCWFFVFPLFVNRLHQKRDAHCMQRVQMYVFSICDFFRLLSLSLSVYFHFCLCFFFHSRSSFRVHFSLSLKFALMFCFLVCAQCYWKSTKKTRESENCSGPNECDTEPAVNPMPSQTEIFILIAISISSASSASSFARAGATRLVLVLGICLLLFFSKQ